MERSKYAPLEDIVIIERLTENNEVFILEQAKFKKPGYKMEVIFKNLFKELKEGLGNFRILSSSQTKIVTTSAEYEIILPGQSLKAGEYKRGASPLTRGKRVRINNSEDSKLLGALGVVYDYKKVYKSGEGYSYWLKVGFSNGSILGVTLPISNVDFL